MLRFSCKMLVKDESVNMNLKTFQNKAQFRLISSVCILYTCKKYLTSEVSKDVAKEEKKRYEKVTHCLFDLDGTVLDSEVIYHKMISQLCEKYGKKYCKDLEIKMYGVTDREICDTVVKQLHLPISADEFELQLGLLSQQMLASAPLMKGAERLLTHLHDNKVPMAIATNSTEEAVRLHARSRPVLFGLFHHKVSVTDPEVKRGKPHPDIYLIAASRFPEQPRPKQCLVFEDSAVGVQAANEAGMQVGSYRPVVMTPHPRLDRELTRQATVVIASLLDFKPELFGLPPFDDQPADKTTHTEERHKKPKTHYVENTIPDEDELK